MPTEDEHSHRRTILRLRPLANRARPRAQRFRRGVYLLPSMFTMANMFCGYACIVHAMRGELATAALFIGFAFVLDMLDGRIARMTGTTSAFGVEFDSLADVISFGVAPAILSFKWGAGAAWSDRMGGRIPLRRGGGRPAGAFQHPGGHAGQALLRRSAEPGRRVHSGGDRLRLSGRVPGIRGSLAGAEHGDRARAPDGQHDSVPQLQVARSSGAPQLSGALPRRCRACRPRLVAAIPAAGDGLHLSGVGLHRPRVAPASSPATAESATRRDGRRAERHRQTVQRRSSR